MKQRVLTSLTEKRAKDRAEMAAKVTALFQEYGYKVEQQTLGPRWISLSAETARGLCVTIDLEGDSVQPDVHVLPWHTNFAAGKNTRLDPAFGLAAGGSVNPYHFGKCTAVAYGYEQLMQQLTAALAMVKDGTAFQKEAA